MMKGTKTDKVPTILAGYREGAKEQLDDLQTRIGNWDGQDIQDLAFMALAAENTAKTVRKLYQLNLQLNQEGLAHGLA